MAAELGIKGIEWLINTVIIFINKRIERGGEEGCSAPMINHFTDKHHKLSRTTFSLFLSFVVKKYVCWCDADH